MASIDRGAVAIAGQGRLGGPPEGLAEAVSRNFFHLASAGSAQILLIEQPQSAAFPHGRRPRMDVHFLINIINMPFDGCQS